MGDDLRKVTTSGLCRDYSQHAHAIERAAKELAGAKEKAKAIKDEIERRMDHTDTAVVVAADGMTFVNGNLFEDFPPGCQAGWSRMPHEVDELLAPQPAGNPDDDGNDADDTGRLVVEAVRTWEVAS